VPDDHAISRHLKSWEEVFARNVEKLRRRYPEGFEKQRALERDLEAERGALEGPTG